MYTQYFLTSLTLPCLYPCSSNTYSSWGESFFILVQVIVILILMFHYNKQLQLLMLLAPLYVVMCWYLTSEYVSLDLLGMLQTSVIFLLLSSRVSVVVGEVGVWCFVFVVSPQSACAR